ncbi:MAG: hypothetical protein A2539_00660 [Elusimicrobia bacterium RIFOXYD2_FULL_34_15]|nr:MAG: hypothetical protein A2539_00660 [Elusimicrobia bacterium RIFOXYD2_FULL_34_15]
MIINAEKLTNRQLNEKIRSTIKKGVKNIILKDVNGHRYIASGLKSDVNLEIFGTAGNDLGSFMSGPNIIVHSNAQDCIANTMDAGKIVIHGSVGDILGYGMRGGKVFIKGNAGYRSGIHMKSYKEMTPVIIIGGSVRDFFAEYMAGGTMILLGLDDSKEIAGNFIGTGMHGGTIYIRGNVKKNQLGREVDIVKMDSEDKKIIENYISEYCKDFKLDCKKILSSKFTKLKALNVRPYGTIYAY